MCRKTLRLWFKFNIFTTFSANFPEANFSKSMSLT